MPNDYVSLDVPAGNGVGAAFAFVNRSTRTVMVTGTWAGLVALEGSADGVNWVPIPRATWASAGWLTLTEPIAEIRVRRSAIAVNEAPGTVVVTVGRTATVIPFDTLPPPGGLNGAGAQVSVIGYVIEAVTVAGSWSNAGMLVYVEISMDGVCWAPFLPAFSQSGTKPAQVTAQYARQRIIGRTVAGAVPTVTISGTSTDTCYNELAFPALNGPGTAVDTSGCGPLKTIVCGAPGGEVPCMISVEGSNDGGNTFVRLIGFNTTGLRQVTALCQFMRVNVEGLVTAVSGLCIGVSSIEGTCDTPSAGDAEFDISGEV